MPCVCEQESELAKTFGTYVNCLFSDSNSFAVFPHGTIDKEETGIYATNPNFNGRSGDPTGKNYLASPRTVAISVGNGKISYHLD